MEKERESGEVRVLEKGNERSVGGACELRVLEKVKTECGSGFAVVKVARNETSVGGCFRVTKCFLDGFLVWMKEVY